MKKFWMCYVYGEKPPTVCHDDKPAALQEAERLAQLPTTRGKQVFVVEAIAVCRAKTVEWEGDVSRDPLNDVPF